MHASSNLPSMRTKKVGTLVITLYMYLLCDAILANGLLTRAFVGHALTNVMRALESSSVENSRARTTNERMRQQTISA